MEINPENENSINDLAQKMAQNPQLSNLIEQQLHLTQQQQTAQTLLNSTTNLQNLTNYLNIVEQLQKQQQLQQNQPQQIQQQQNEQQKIEENLIETGKSRSCLSSLSNKMDKMSNSQTPNQQGILFNIL